MRVIHAKKTCPESECLYETITYNIHHSAYIIQSPILRQTALKKHVLDSDRGGTKGISYRSHAHRGNTSNKRISGYLVSSACAITLTYKYLSFPWTPPICHSPGRPPFVILPKSFYRESSVFAFDFAVFQPFSAFLHLCSAFQIQMSNHIFKSLVELTKQPIIC